MDKEKLEKEAREKYHNHKTIDFQGFYNHHYYYLGYVESAEPREKRIEELEAQIEKMKNWCNCKNYQECLIELAEQGKGMNPSECCVNCKKWEIKEK